MYVHCAGRKTTKKMESTEIELIGDLGFFR